MTTSCHQFAVCSFAASGECASLKSDDTTDLVDILNSKHHHQLRQILLIERSLAARVHHLLGGEGLRLENMSVNALASCSPSFLVESRLACQTKTDRCTNELFEKRSNRRRLPPPLSIKSSCKWEEAEWLENWFNGPVKMVSIWREMNRNRSIL